MGSEEDEKPREQVAAQIDENLRRVYAEVAEGEVPDRFKNLLEQLRAQDAGQEAGE